MDIGSFLKSLSIKVMKNERASGKIRMWYMYQMSGKLRDSGLVLLSIVEFFLNQNDSKDTE